MIKAQIVCKLRDEYDRLESNSAMLGQIAGVARRYCRTPYTTTLDCVIAMDARVKRLNAQIKKLKQLTNTNQ